MNRIGAKIVAMLALIVVSLYLYGCSPSASPQTETNVLVLQPETQAEAVPESIEKMSLEEAAPQAKLLAQENPTDQADAPAQAEPAQSESSEGVGGGASEPESFAQVDPAPTQESIPEEAVPAPTQESIPQEAPPAAQVQQTGSTTEPSVGLQAPEFNLQTLDGQSLQLSALRGKNVLLSYWVTWCIPCMEELPLLNQLSQEYQAQDLVILSVNGIKQDEMDKVMAAVADLGISMQIAMDQDDTIWNSYWVRFLPTSFFIDENGVIRHIQLGNLSEEDLRLKIDQLITDQL